MPPIDVQQIVAWSAGQLIQGPPKRVLSGLSTDSRLLQPGEGFIALQGERFDGHAFLADVVEKGAAAVIVNGSGLSNGYSVPSDIPIVRVPNTTKALANIARGYAEQFRIPVVAVTGSNGKTSTKDMIGSILRRRWPIIVTEKNFNNEIGLPLTLLKLEEHHQAAVVELGMRSLGEIAQLAEVARPTVGVVTNVGPVHLENLGTIEKVADAKAELVEALPADGVAILNGDDERVRQFARRTEAQVVYYGFSEHVDVRAVKVQTEGLTGSSFMLMFQGESIPIRLPIPGRHQVQNAAAAAACALAHGVGPEDIQKALSEFSLGEMRLKVLRLADGVTLINDAYNASPLSTAAALDVLAQTDAKRRVAVLGDMLELGSLTTTAHREIGRHAVESGAALLVAIGEHREVIAEGARQAGLSEKAVHSFPTAEDAAMAVPQWARVGDVILVKGSRGVRLERVADEIERHFISEEELKEPGES